MPNVISPNVTSPIVNSASNVKSLNVTSYVYMNITRRVYIRRGDIRRVCIRRVNIRRLYVRRDDRTPAKRCEIGRRLGLLWDTHSLCSHCQSRWNVMKWTWIIIHEHHVSLFQTCMRHFETCLSIHVWDFFACFMHMSETCCCIQVSDMSQTCRHTCM